MKILLLSLILFCLCAQLISQQNNFDASLEYSPAFSKSSHSPYYPDNGFRLTHSGFLKAGYKLTKNLRITSGLGYLTTAEFTSREINGFPEISRIDKTEFHHYVVIPFGFKYNFGSFYINPEIGIGYNIRNSAIQFTHLSIGDVTKSKYDSPNWIFHAEKISIPLFLSLGNEIDIRGHKFTMGLKGYYNLKSTYVAPYWPRTAFGFGAIVGVRI